MIAPVIDSCMSRRVQRYGGSVNENEKGAFSIVFSDLLAASSMGQIAGMNLQSPSFHNLNQHLFTTKIVKIIVPVWL